MWSLAHSNLQKACMYLFPTSPDCRLLVADSGMDASQINFEEPPALRWQSVINEAEKQNTMQKLVPILLARYPDNPVLKAACMPFSPAEPVRVIPVHAAEQPQTPPEPKPSEQKLEEEIEETPVPKGAALVKKFEGNPKDKAADTQDAPPKQTAEETLDATRRYNGGNQPSPMEYTDMVATVQSLRMEVAALYIEILELKSWRRRLSAMNSAEIVASAPLPSAPEAQ